MILLSFDIEEFDMPAEYGVEISKEEQLRISTEGLVILLDLLKSKDVKATFFVTGVFAINCSELVRRMVEEGHEVASHGFYHTEFAPEDLLRSRETLEQVSGSKVEGYRAPRMRPPEDSLIKDAGFSYSASLNPCFLPGRYNNSSEPRSIFRRGGLIQVPASVSACMRIPLFWLSMHNFPMWIYRFLCRRALKHDGYLCLYNHPWEFSDELKNMKYLPFVARNNSGSKLVERLGGLIDYFKVRGEKFSTISSYLKSNYDK